MLDVRPTIHHDRKYLTLEIQPTVAKVVALRNFSSTLGGNTSPVEFQLPELRGPERVHDRDRSPTAARSCSAASRTSATSSAAPKCRGSRRSRSSASSSSDEGYNDENKSLMILIRAHDHRRARRARAPRAQAASQRLRTAIRRRVPTAGAPPGCVCRRCAAVAPGRSLRRLPSRLRAGVASLAVAQLCARSSSTSTTRCSRRPSSRSRARAQRRASDDRRPGSTCPRTIVLRELDEVHRRVLLQLRAPLRQAAAAPAPARLTRT